MPISLGKKIRQARLEAGLTQSQLAGNFITRNMLSQIENGTASPSVHTIQYLAKQLNVSVSYLMSEEADSFLYKKAAVIQNIRQKLKDKDYNSCIGLCAAFCGHEDDEINLILAECFCYTAIEDYKNGKLKYAKNGFEAALRYASQTIYSTEWLQAISLIFLEFIDYIHLTKNNSFDETLRNHSEIFSFIQNTMPFDSLIYYSTMKLIQSGLPQAAEIVLNSGVISKHSYLYHLKAKLAMLEGNYTAAYEFLRHINVSGETSIMKFQIYSDLEQIYTQTGDFEKAYHCSKIKLELYASMHE